MPIVSHLSIITLSAVLKLLIKSHRVTGWIKKKIQLYVVYKRPTVDLRTQQAESEGTEKGIICKW